MRTHKYKFWDIEEKRWTKPWNIVVDEFTGELCVEKGPNGETWTESFEEAGIIPCKFTGLHDKNGKEIYEGDIVRYNPERMNGLGDKLLVNAVVWDEDRFKLDRFSAEGYYWEECEAIGNIHSNPELLNG